MYGSTDADGRSSVDADVWEHCVMGTQLKCAFCEFSHILLNADAHGSQRLFSCDSVAHSSVAY